jgi:sugar lactone lactonase YvrE
MTSIDVAIKADAILGEGPAWDSVGGRLLWVDILADRVHISDLASGSTRTRQFEYPVGAVIPTTTGDLLLTTPSGLEIVSDLDDPARLLVGIETDIPNNRMNDGKCDPTGRLWTGTMDIAAEPEKGSLYRVDGDLGVEVILDGVTISNGLAFAPDLSAAFFIDTVLQRVDRLVLDDGSIVSRDIFCDLSGQPGVPDGMSRDDSGCLWIAMYAGECLLRVSPDGVVDKKVDLPTTNPSSTTFADDGLDVLVVTTGKDDKPAGQSLGGSVLAVDVGISGAPTYPFTFAP